MFMDLKSLVEQREDAIAQSKLNCKKLKTFMTYGVDSFVDRLPSFSTSILKRPEGFSVSSNNKYVVALTDEIKDKEFIERMCLLFAHLKEPYKEVFIAYFIKNTKIKDIYPGTTGNSVSKILERGYLKLALLDAEIDYSYCDEVQYKLKNEEHKTKRNLIIKQMKARLYLVQSLMINNTILLTTNSDGFLIVENVKMEYEEYKIIFNLIQWINNLCTLSSKSGLSPKDAVIKFIFDNDWKYLGTTDRNNFLRGILALAYLDESINYSIEQFEYDVYSNCKSQSFINEIKNFQFSLKV